VSLPPQPSGVDIYSAGQLNRLANAQSMQVEAMNQQNSLIAEQNRIQKRREDLEIKRRNQVNLLHDIKTFQMNIQQNSNVGIVDFLHYTNNMNLVFGKSDFSMLERVEELEMKRDVVNSYHQNYNIVKLRLPPEIIKR
jgi:hypothetical protein